MALSEEQLSHIAKLVAEESSDKAVRKVFAILGVNIDEPKEVEEFREDLRFGRRLRRATDKGFFSVAGLLAVGAALASWEGMKHILHLTK